ncbi:MAG: hypothetical protein QOF36_1207 [Microbacteriaceae bacterium]|jgi:predicted sugar kinase|nr:hypothetical protein [Microbacteriaceae bacterium]
MEATTIPAADADTFSAIVDAIVDLERMISSIDGVRAELLDQARRASGLGSETQLAVSESLVHDLYDTLAALQAGEISYRHARIMFDNTCAAKPS